MLINSLFILLKVSAVLLLEHALPPLLIKAKAKCVCFYTGRIIPESPQASAHQGSCNSKTKTQIKGMLASFSSEFGLLRAWRESVTLCLPRVLLMNTRKGLYHYRPVVKGKREGHVCLNAYRATQTQWSVHHY